MIWTGQCRRYPDRTLSYYHVDSTCGQHRPMTAPRHTWSSGRELQGVVVCVRDSPSVTMPGQGLRRCPRRPEAINHWRPMATCSSSTTSAHHFRRSTCTHFYIVFFLITVGWLRRCVVYTFFLPSSLALHAVVQWSHFLIRFHPSSISHYILRFLFPRRCAVYTFFIPLS